ncbi:MAG: phosphatase PAP2 family protein [Flavobacteriales bacterium]|nr:MAG: phosphatase PAP2 family protein [Flavobacteriales bacterium]
MIDFLDSLDRSLILVINGCNSELMDQFMWFFSGPFIVIPIVLIILWTLYQSYSLKQSGWILLGIIITIAIADLSSVYLFKEVFMRYRPSHHIELSQHLHFYQFENGDFYKGGKYGFVSSHAANYFALLVLVYGLIEQHWIKILLVLITLIILYSRVYLGVHYVSDVICGAILGYLIAKVVLHFLILKQIKR